jgi:hypothetical protein
VGVEGSCRDNGAGGKDLGAVRRTERSPLPRHVEVHELACVVLHVGAAPAKSRRGAMSWDRPAPHVRGTPADPPPRPSTTRMARPLMAARAAWPTWCLQDEREDGKEVARPPAGISAGGGRTSESASGLRTRGEPTRRVASCLRTDALPLPAQGSLVLQGLPARGAGLLPSPCSVLHLSLSPLPRTALPACRPAAPGCEAQTLLWDPWDLREALQGRDAEGGAEPAGAPSADLTWDPWAQRWVLELRQDSKNRADAARGRWEGLGSRAYGRHQLG